MLPAWPLALLVAAAPTPEGPQVTYDLARRAPLAYLVNFGGAGSASVRATAMRRALSQVLAQTTILEAVDVESNAVQRCVSGTSDGPIRAGLITCLTQAAVPFKVGESGIFEDRWADLESQGRARRLALFLSVTPRKDSVRLSAVLLDVKAGLREIDAFAQRVRSPTQDQQDELEDRLVRDITTRVPTEPISDDEEALRSYFETAFASRLRDPLEENGYSQPYGSIEIDSKEKQAKLQIDGKFVGEIPAGRIVVRNVPPGPHQLQIQRPGFDDFEQSVLVAPNQQTTVEMGAASQTVGTARTIMKWTGVGVGALGAIALITGALHALFRDSGVVGETGQVKGRFTLGEATARPWDRLGPLPLVPIGYSLLAAGGGTAASVFLTEEDVVPWLPASISVAAGATALGLSLTLEDNPTPVEL